MRVIGLKPQLKIGDEAYLALDMQADQDLRSSPLRNSNPEPKFVWRVNDPRKSTRSGRCLAMMLKLAVWIEVWADAGAFSFQPVGSMAN